MAATANGFLFAKFHIHLTKFPIMIPYRLRLHLFTFFLLAAFFSPTYAQQTKDYYSFWSDGKWQSELTIYNGDTIQEKDHFIVEKIDQKNAFEESWKIFIGEGEFVDAKAIRGFDESSKKWSLYYVDDRSAQHWESQLIDGTLYFSRAFQFQDKTFYSRQAWSLQPDGKVLRTIERSEDQQHWKLRYWQLFNRVEEDLPSLIDDFVERNIEAYQLPSLALAIVKNGDISHLKAYGYRDLVGQVPSTIHTPYQIASVSKTVTAMAIFHLVQVGKIDLEEDISTYLPFKVKNPHTPGEIISVSDLLNHRSGIWDDYELYRPFWSVPQGDPDWELVDFLEAYLTPAGQFYKEKNFAPEDKAGLFSYSNTGYAILGLIVEQVSQLSFESYCQATMFQPTGMTNTSWFLKNLKESEVAKPYVGTDSTAYVFKGHNGYPDYPAGQLRTSISDFAHLIKGYLNADSTDFFLSANTIKKITPNPSSAQTGFHTLYLAGAGKRIYYEHGGGDTGVSTTLFMDPAKKNAIIIFCNTNFAVNKLWRKIEEMAFGT